MPELELVVDPELDPVLELDVEPEASPVPPPPPPPPHAERITSETSMQLHASILAKSKVTLTCLRSVNGWPAGKMSVLLSARPVN